MVNIAAVLAVWFAGSEIIFEFISILLNTRLLSCLLHLIPCLELLYALALSIPYYYITETEPYTIVMIVLYQGASLCLCYPR